MLVFHGPAAEQQDPVARAARRPSRSSARRTASPSRSPRDPAVFTAAEPRRVPRRGVPLRDGRRAQPRPGGRAAELHQGRRRLRRHRRRRPGPARLDLVHRPDRHPPGRRASRSPSRSPAVTASAENPPNETKEKLIDGDANTKWLAFARRPAGSRYELDAADGGHRVRAHVGQRLRRPRPEGLDPAGLHGRHDLDRPGHAAPAQTFPERFQTRRFDIANATAYQHYRLNITANSGEPLIQLADLRLFAGRRRAAAGAAGRAARRSSTSSTASTRPTRALPLTVTRSDRGCNWDPNPVGNVHTVAQVEERQLQPGRGRQRRRSTRSPGAATTTAAGRSTPAWAAPRAATPRTAFRNHLAGAAQWTTGIVRGDCQATIARQLQGRAADRDQPDRPARPDRRAARPDHRAGRHGLLRRQGGLPDRPGRRLGRPERRPGLRHHPPVGPGDQAGQAAHHAAR